MSRSRRSLGKKSVPVLEDSQAGVQTQVCFEHGKADLRPQSSEFSQLPSLFLSRSAATKQSPPLTAVAPWRLLRSARNDKYNIVEERSKSW